MLTIEQLVNNTLLGLLVITAIAIVRLRSLFAVAMLTGIYSLLSASVFVVLDAVDVAFTEAAVGAGFSTVLMLGTLALLSSHTEKRPRHLPVLPLIVVIATGLALVYGTLDMPRWGDPESAVHKHVAPYYLNVSPDEIGIPNVVTSVLASYRGYDTLGEVTVIFTAGVGVLILLGGRRGGREGSAKKLRDLLILRVVAKLFIPLILLFALYVQFHGEYGPGGGFQAGVIFAAGFILYALVYELETAHKVAPTRLLRVLMAGGLLIYAGVGIDGLLLGGHFLDYSVLLDDPVHGQHLGITLIELGVGLTVASTLIVIFYSFAGRRR